VLWSQNPATIIDPCTVYLGKLYGAASLSETERAANQVLPLPLFPELSPEQVRRVAKAICTF
jgi:dTDP-4-amino-4,6-dideoxygalactose transaminase